MPSRCRLIPLRRSGCTTCKHRHKKCDEQKPRCGNCLRLSLDCKPSELFKASKLPRYNIDRLSYFNCALDAASAEDSAPLDSHENQVLLDNGDEDDDVVDVVGSTAQSTPLMSCIGFQPSQGVLITCAQPQASSVERYLLHYYTFKLSTVLINVDSPSNPLRSVLLPRAVTSPTLMNALYATSALHAFVGNRDPDFRILSLAYYNKAVCALRHLMANLEPQRERADLEILLLTAVYLCKYEIISGGVSNWRSHLQGIQQLFETSICQENISKLAPETVAYVQSFISYHTHIAALTTFRKLSSPTTTYLDQYFEIAMGALNTKIDPYMGVSANLISLLYVAAETIMVDPMKPSNLGLMMKNVIKVYHRLRSDRVEASISFGPSDELTLETINCLDHIANAYRDALVAYLHIILDAIEAHTVTDELMLQCLGMRTLLVSTKVEAISACVRDMVCVPEDKSCAVGLVPLLFIVASETRNRTEFEIASQRLQAILKTACLGNIAPALELLQKTQQSNSGDWRQILKGFGWDLIIT